ncbi:NUDIX domain-containing protein [Agrobacterium tumefaciens]|uniref:NUDIX domain-containing protein n=1 Tax=Agrobacterium tumefaciens TaxID=358 RepID=UPI001B89F2EC
MLSAGGEKRIRVRVAGLVFYQDEILIVEHGNGSDVWACFPGGRMEPGESPEECISRELLEELQLPCTVEYLAGVGDFIDTNSHNLELFFKCSVRSKEIVIDQEELRSAQFVNVADLGKWTIYPLEVTEKIGRIYSATDADAIYFGRFS